MARPTERIGPYRIVDTLGEGGMGVVYCGEHNRTGERAAIKTVLRATAGLLGHMRREIHALSRIHHPGVIRVLGQGTADARPWYAMELLQGQTMRDWLQGLWPHDGVRVLASNASTADGDSPATLTLETLVSSARALLAVPRSAATRSMGGSLTQATHSLDLDQAWSDAPAAVGDEGARPSEMPPGPVPMGPPLVPAAGGQLPTVLTAIRRLCAPLAYVHGEGIVHCDLKPENIFLRGGDLPVLADFGLVANIHGSGGREVLEVAGGIRGTLPYMAPEQLRGTPLDARADLYALGCMLYESLCGRPPFGGTPERIVASHLSAQPIPPSEFVDGIPPELEELVLKLLAKRPHDRIGFADDVAATLVRLGADPLDAEDLPQPRGYLYRPEMVGRQESVQRVLGLVRQAQAGECRHLFVGGESGVGKTRFVVEVGLRAEEQDVRVIVGQCHDLSANTGEGVVGGPLHPFRPLLEELADQCLEGGREVTRRLLGDRGPVLMAYAPSLRDAPGVSEQPRPAPLGPDEARTRLFFYLADTLRALTREQPLMLILDDLQWADELTLAFLRSPQFAGLTDVGMLLVTTYRSEELQPEIEQLLAAEQAEQILLERLGEREIGFMVRDMLAMPAAPTAFVGFLSRQSEGNPFFVAEYLRTAVAEQILRRDGTGTWRVAVDDDGDAAAYDDLPLPRSLRELVDLRLHGLSPGSRRMVEAGSVLGREFDPAVLAEALGLEGQDLLEGLRELMARQVIEAEGDGYRFLHDKVREIPYEGMSEERQRTLHAKVADAIVAVKSEGIDLELQAAVGRHYALGGAPDPAIRYLEEAGRLFQEIHANQQAIEAYELAAEQATLLPARAPSARLGSAAIESRLLERLGDVLALVGRQEDARAALERAITADERSRTAAGSSDLHGEAVLRRASLLRRIGTACWTHHYHEEAMDRLAAAESTLGEPPGVEAADWWREWISIQLQRGWVEYWRVQADDMEGWLDQAEAVLDRYGTPLQRTTYFQMRAALQHRRDRYRVTEEAMQHSRQAYAVVEHLGDDPVVASALFERGFGHLFNDNLADAQEDLVRALAMAQRVGDLTIQSRCISYLSMTLRRLGAVEEVRGRAAEAIAIAKASGMNDYVATAKANLGWAAWREGRIDQACRYCEDSLEIWRPMGGAYPFEWMGRLPLFAIRLAEGDLASTAELAEQILSPKQQRLPDPLAEALAATAETWQGGQPRAASQWAAEAVELAKSAGFL